MEPVPGRSTVPRHATDRSAPLVRLAPSLAGCKTCPQMAVGAWRGRAPARPHPATRQPARPPPPESSAQSGGAALASERPRSAQRAASESLVRGLSGRCQMRYVLARPLLCTAHLEDESQPRMEGLVDRRVYFPHKQLTPFPCVAPPGRTAGARGARLGVEHGRSNPADMHGATWTRWDGHRRQVRADCRSGTRRHG